MKLFELCKTRAKKSRPDMFNFYVGLAHNMVTDTGRAITCRRNFKALSLQTKGIKNEVPFENMGFNGRQFEDSDEKKNKIPFQPGPNNPMKRVSPKCKN